MTQVASKVCPKGAKWVARGIQMSPSGAQCRAWGSSSGSRGVQGVGVSRGVTRALPLARLTKSESEIAIVQSALVAVSTGPIVPPVGLSVASTIHITLAPPGPGHEQSRERMQHRQETHGIHVSSRR